MADLVAAGSGIEDILDRLGIDKMHPTYLDWKTRGYPTGNAGIVVYKDGSTFRIEAYRQHG